MKVLWVTSCGPDMWTASGRALVKSFLARRVDGLLAAYPEGVPPADLPETRGRVAFRDLAGDPYLAAWLDGNRAFIPATLGGDLPEPLCGCPGGPLTPHDKGHKMPCAGHWFNKNHSRWFRKFAAIRRALAEHKGVDALVWVDSDCTFRRDVPAAVVRGWFRGKACFYLKHRRPVIEAGVLGYQLAAGGRKLLDCLFDRYDSGRYRKDARWDDSYQIQQALAETRVPAVDLARAVGAHAAVVEHSEVGPYLSHRKGHHGRGLGLMK